MSFPPPRWLWGTVASLSLLAILFLGSNYEEWKTARLRKSAADLLEQDRNVEAALDAAAALQIVPDDPELISLLGDAYEATNDERLLDVLAKEIALEPTSLDPRFRLARAAMRFGRLDLSSAAVSEMPAEAAGTADYHEIGSALATVSKQGDLLLQHAHELYRIEPENREHLFKLAGLSVMAGEFNLTEVELKNLRALHGESINATILLWAVSRLPGYSGEDAATIEAELVPALASSEVSFGTRVQALDLAVATRQDESADEILELMRNVAAASGDHEEISVLLAWMNRQKDFQAAFDWSSELELFQGSKPTARFAAVLADTCAHVAAWDELDWIVTGSDWGSGDFIRNFYAAKCAAERPSPTAEMKRASFLRSALKDSDSSPGEVYLLWETARKYGWYDLAVPLSWRIVELSPNQSTRYAVLERIAEGALVAGDLAGFQKATKTLLRSSSKWELRNNNFYAALLGEGCDAERLAEIEAFHEEFKIYPGVRTTYALALHLSGESGAAAKVLSELDESILNSAEVAPFCALIFAASGDEERAERYRDLPHRLFFPEEEAMLALAR